jgi:colicin import membrane protein
MSDTQDQAKPQGQVAYDATSAIAFTGQAQRALANANDFTIDSDEMLEAAGDDLRAVKTLQKKVEDQRTSITGPLNAVVRTINDLFRQPAAFLDQAEAKLKGAMLTYTTEQERIAAEARRKAEEAARIERERLAEEQRQQEEQARAAAAAAAQAEREAQTAAAAGDHEAARKAEEVARQQSEIAENAAADAHATATTAAVVSMPPTVRPAAKVAGISTSKTVDFEVTDLHALVKHIAAHPEQISLVMPDAVKLRAQVRATGMNTKLPGVNVFEKRGMSARAA